MRTIRPLTIFALVAFGLLVSVPAPAQEPEAPAVEAALPAEETEATEATEAPQGESETPMPEAEAVTPVAAAAMEPATEPTTKPATAQGVVARTSEAIGEGTSTVVGQGREIWYDVLKPMWRSLASAVPSLLKALGVLVLFWLGAWAAGSGTRRLLGMTRVDERAADDWGLGKMLERPDGSKRSLERIAGGAVKWVILLFGFVAFFQALDLEMVAGPLQNVVDRLVGVIPDAIKASVILLAYWAVASLARFGTARGLQAIGFDERFGRRLASGGAEDREGTVPTSEQIGRLVFYVILLLGLGPFLAALGQQTLLGPLNAMLAEALAYIPNVVAALLLFFIGRVIAVVVREIVSNFLAAVGFDSAAKKLGVDKLTDDRKASDVVGAFAYFLVLVPVLAAAVEALGVRAISEPVQATLGRLLAVVPLALAAAVIALVGFFVARTVRDLVASFLEGVGTDTLPSKVGLGFLQPKEGQRTASEVIAAFVMLVILLVTAQQAFATLGLAGLSGMLTSVLAYLPALLTGLAVIVAGLSLSGYVAGLVSSALGGHAQSGLVATVARVAVLVLAFGIGLAQLGLGEEIVSIAVAAVFGALALGIGLALGLGGKDKARELVERIQL